MVKRVINLPPSRWEGYVSGAFRLAGFGGAALMLRSAVVPGTVTGGSGTGLVFDIGLVDPQRRVFYLHRPAGSDLVARLSGFCRSAAADLHPQASLLPLQDVASGLLLSVESSTETTVDLMVQVVQEMDAGVREYDGLGFSTSRAALASAALEVRWLDRIADGGAAGQEPLFWDGEA